MYLKTTVWHIIWSKWAHWYRTSCGRDFHEDKVELPETGPQEGEKRCKKCFKEG